MAETPRPELVFEGGCPDCGQRRIRPPDPVPGVPDDFDWLVRDYDSFRLAMMQDLAARAPERTRWTPADMEVVIVELLAAALDRLSHALDTIQGERFLDSARRPQSVHRLLALIGYDAVANANPRALDAARAAAGEPNLTDAEALARSWRLDPQAMERARAAGPAAIREQKRMVTVADHAQELERHPLVARAFARTSWSGSWTVVTVALLLRRGRRLDQPLADLTAGEVAAIEARHRARGAVLPDLAQAPTAREVLHAYVEQHRMLGREVRLSKANEVGITFQLSVLVGEAYYRSEVERALKEVFSSAPGGFFEPGLRGFGADLFASDLVEAALAVEGVEVACINRLKRVGRRHPDVAGSGRLEIAPDEIVVCENRAGAPERGYFRIILHGGIPG
jgi:hypothetical protein